MAGPLIVGIVAFLTGAGTPALIGSGTAAKAAADAAAVEAIGAKVYADLPAICAAADPLIDLAQDAADANAQGKVTLWRHIAADTAAAADAACAAVAKNKNDPLGHLAVAAAAVAAIVKAEQALSTLPGPSLPAGLTKPASAPPPASGAPAAPSGRNFKN